MNKNDLLDEEVHRLLHGIKEAEKSIKDNSKFREMVKKLIKMHEEGMGHKEESDE